MYLDGEMPSETAKERLQFIAEQFGSDLQLWFYSREVMPDTSGWPPLNTEEGEKWLFEEIEAVRPDLIIFDSVMSLLLGEMGDEKAWAPVNLMMRKISQRRMGQIWLHHTGHDKSRGFGTKTREWQMDTVAILTRPEDDEEVDDDAIELKFTKARLGRRATAISSIPNSSSASRMAGRSSANRRPGVERAGRALLKASSREGL